MAYPNLSYSYIILMSGLSSFRPSSISTYPSNYNTGKCRYIMHHSDTVTRSSNIIYIGLLLINDLPILPDTSLTQGIYISRTLSISGIPSRYCIGTISTIINDYFSTTLTLNELSLSTSLIQYL